MSFELFCRYWNPHRVEEVNCMLPTSTQTPDGLEPEGWWRWLPVTSHQPIRRASTSWSHTPQPPLLPCLKKSFPESLQECSRLFSTSCLGSLLGSCNRCCPLLHHNPVPGDWLYCLWASRPKCGSVTIPEHVHPSKKKPHHQSLPTSSCPQPLATLNLVFVSMDFPVLDISNTWDHTVCGCFHSACFLHSSMF